MSERLDLSTFNLLIASPVMDGRLEVGYQHSLKYTEELIKEHGGKCSVNFLQYIADVGYARNKLLSEFVRKKEFTHLLMIDADMSWQPKDVAYMLYLRRDFLAAVGAKKKYPLEFAFTMLGDAGKETHFEYEAGSNVAYVPFVGGAFVMLSRSCAEKLIAAYPETEYLSATGDMDYGIFDSVILTEGGQKRRLSEDYALCWRWRKIGGEVAVKMDVVLGHHGSHKFEGCLMDSLVTKEVKNG